MDNLALLSDLTSRGALRTPALVEAFRRMDRRHFVPPAQRDQAYLDAALPIGPQQTISQPSTVAMMLEWLAPQPGDRVLDVGSGSGWTVALLADIVGDAGRVYGIELDSDLAQSARDRLQKLGITNATITAGDGRRGWPERAPFDRIKVAAAAVKPPLALKNQLKIGGTLVLPVGTGTQEIQVITRRADDDYQVVSHPGFRFVPLR